MDTSEHSFLRFGTGVLAALLILAGSYTGPAVAQPDASSVVIDRFDKQNLTGQTRIAIAWGQHFDMPSNLSIGIVYLKDAMNRWTKVQTSMDRHLMLSDQRIHDIPFVFVTADQTFELTETERQNVRTYFENGGFMFLDNASPVNEYSASGSALKQLLRDTIPNARFEPIPETHSIYHSFFEFNDGPPRGAELGLISTLEGLQVPSPERFFLQGVWYRGRLVAVYSDKGYILKWAEDDNNEPQLKMGVNLIVHALVQEGSIASQQMR